MTSIGLLTQEVNRTRYGRHFSKGKGSNFITNIRHFDFVFGRLNESMKSCLKNRGAEESPYQYFFLLEYLSYFWVWNVFNFNLLFLKSPAPNPYEDCFKLHFRMKAFVSHSQIYSTVNISWDSQNIFIKSQPWYSYLIRFL